MIDNLKHNDYEEMDIDYSIDKFLDSIDFDTFIMLWFYSELVNLIF